MVRMREYLFRLSCSITNTRDQWWVRYSLVILFLFLLHFITTEGCMLKWLLFIDTFSEIHDALHMNNWRNWASGFDSTEFFTLLTIKQLFLLEFWMVRLIHQSHIVLEWLFSNWADNTCYASHRKWNLSTFCLYIHWMSFLFRRRSKVTQRMSQKIENGHFSAWVINYRIRFQ